jgi:6-phosphogluconolactonase
MHVFPDRSALVHALAARMVELAAAAIAARGKFTIALSGGSTPEQLYRLLSTSAYASQFDWPRVHVFWGDERCVGPEDTDSNYRMTKACLLDHVPLPASHIHRMRGELEPARAAISYAEELRTVFASGERWPCFDLVLLGLGSDGHTASLFPGSAALGVAENEKGADAWVLPNYVERLGAWRLTLTLPVINAARVVNFLVAGADKAPIVQQVLGSAGDELDLPARLVRPAPGELEWWLDAAAAQLVV